MGARKLKAVFGSGKAGLLTVQRCHLDSTGALIGSWGGMIKELGVGVGTYSVYEVVPASTCWIAWRTGDVGERFLVEHLVDGAYSVQMSPVDTGKTMESIFLDFAGSDIGTWDTAGWSEFLTSGIYLFYTTYTPNTAAWLMVRLTDLSRPPVILSLTLANTLPPSFIAPVPSEVIKPPTVVRTTYRDIGNYWGPDIRGIIRGRNVTAKMIRANTDALRAGNFRAYLWQAIEAPYDCTCVKKVAGAANDGQCLTCYGTGRIGGYEKYGFTTQFFSASDVTGLTLTGVERDLARTPHRFRLQSSETLGYIETAKFRVENPLLAPFEYKFDSWAREPANSSVNVVFALNDDPTWHDIADLPRLVMRQGYLRFKVVIVRSSTAVQSPQFEAMRFRWQTGRDALLRISRNQGQRRRNKTNWGDTEDEGGIKIWMSPYPQIRAFIEPLNEDGSGLVSGAARADSQKKGIDPFFEVAIGSRRGERYLILTVARSEPLGRIVSQKFSVRVIQLSEVFYSVF